MAVSACLLIETTSNVGPVAEMALTPRRQRRLALLTGSSAEIEHVAAMFGMDYFRTKASSTTRCARWSSIERGASFRTWRATASRHSSWAIS
jgi:hypothetical protein